MSTSAAQKRAVTAYDAKAYDKFIVRVKKGKHAEIKSFAESNGESLNGFINRLIEEAINNASQNKEA
jgi:predicted HicB family RNase H-like nuclease